MIELRGIRKTYSTAGQLTIALSDVDLSIGAGEIFGLIGHSGAGKSTLLRCINLLERPSAGSITVDGLLLSELSAHGLRDARRRIGMIFQGFNLLSSATVVDNVALPLRLEAMPEREARQRVDELIERVGLTDHRNKYPAQLSGGQKQRVGIARALSTRPSILLCDEATSALDPTTTQTILALLREINQEMGLTMVVVTHEMGVIRDLCDRVAVLDAGAIIETGRVADVFLKPTHKLTRELVGGAGKLLPADDLLARYSSMSAAERSRRAVLQLSMLGEVVSQPILSNLVAAHPVRFNILSGLVSNIKGTSFGQLLVELRGEAAELGDAVSWLQAQREVFVEVVL